MKAGSHGLYERLATLGEGYVAGLRLGITLNPHPPHTAAREDWNEGWRKGRDHSASQEREGVRRARWARRVVARAGTVGRRGARPVAVRPWGTVSPSGSA